MSVSERRLTAEDRLEIQQLMSEYSFHEDRGSAQEWGALFTHDGSFVGLGKAPVSGRDNLVAFAVRRWNEKPHVRNRTHWISNIVISPTAEGAISQSFQMSVDLEGDQYKIANISAKADQLRREDGQWRFYERRIVPIRP